MNVTVIAASQGSCVGGGHIIILEEDGTER